MASWSRCRACTGPASNIAPLEASTSNSSSLPAGEIRYKCPYQLLPWIAGRWRSHTPPGLGEDGLSNHHQNRSDKVLQPTMKTWGRWSDPAHHQGWEKAVLSSSSMIGEDGPQTHYQDWVKRVLPPTTRTGGDRPLTQYRDWVKDCVLPRFWAVSPSTNRQNLVKVYFSPSTKIGWRWSPTQHQDLVKIVHPTSNPPPLPIWKKQQICFN